MNITRLQVHALTVACCATALGATAAAPAQETASWVFQPGTYTHDPATGARVAQYQRKPAIEPLGDPRLVTSRYRRIRTTLRGADGSVDSAYEVQNFGNGRGGLDAEWERFHDAWRQSFLSGSYYYQNPSAPYGGGPYPGYRYPAFAPGYGYPAHGGPGYRPPGYGGPAYGPPRHGGPGHGPPGPRRD